MRPSSVWPVRSHYAVWLVGYPEATIWTLKVLPVHLLRRLRPWQRPPFLERPEHSSMDRGLEALRIKLSELFPAYFAA